MTKAVEHQDMRLTFTLRESAALRNTAPLLIHALCLIVGQLLGIFCPASIVAALTCSIPAALIKQYSKLLWFGVGLCSALLLPGPLVDHPHEAVVFGVVVGEPQHPEPGLVTFLFDIKESLKGDLPEQYRFKCRSVDLPWRNSRALSDGTEVYLRGVFSGLVKAHNPFSYDAWLVRRSIQGTCKVLFASVSQIKTPSPWTEFRASAVSWIVEKLGDSETTGVLLSMLLGVSEGVSISTEKTFVRLGLLHVLIISGFQVGLLFLLCRAALKISVDRFLPRSLRFISPLFSLALMGGYVQLCGWQPAAVRALIAIVMTVVAAHVEGKRTLFHGSIVALIVTSLIWPGSIGELGSQLTYTALFGISLGISASRKKSAFVSAICVSLIATMATSCVLILWDRPLSYLSLILNITLTPLLSWLAGPCTVAAIAPALIGIDPHAYLLQAIHWCLGIILAGMRWAEPYAVLIESIFEKVTLLGLYLIILGVILRKVVTRHLLFKGMHGDALRGEGH